MPVTYSAAIPSNPSPQFQAARKFQEATVSLDAEAVEAVTTDDFVHHYLPEDAGLPTWPKAALLQRINMGGKLGAEMKMDVTEIIESPGVVAFLLDVHVKTKGGNTSDSTPLNLIYVAEQPDGSYKVYKTREFVDTHKYTAFNEAIKKELGL